MKAVFEEAVESYLETCEQVGKKPDKLYTGTCNVRVNTELHPLQGSYCFQAAQY